MPGGGSDGGGGGDGGDGGAGVVIVMVVMVHVTTNGVLQCRLNHCHHLRVGHTHTSETCTAELRSFSPTVLPPSL